MHRVKSSNLRDPRLVGSLMANRETGSPYLADRRSKSPVKPDDVANKWLDNLSATGQASQEPILKGHPSIYGKTNFYFMKREPAETHLFTLSDSPTPLHQFSDDSRFPGVYPNHAICASDESLSSEIVVNAKISDLPHQRARNLIAQCFKEEYELLQDEWSIDDGKNELEFENQNLTFLKSDHPYCALKPSNFFEMAEGKFFRSFSLSPFVHFSAAHLTDLFSRDASDSKSRLDAYQVRMMDTANAWLLDAQRNVFCHFPNYDQTFSQIAPIFHLFYDPIFPFIEKSKNQNDLEKKNEFPENDSHFNFQSDKIIAYESLPQSADIQGSSVLFGTSDLNESHLLDDSRMSTDNFRLFDDLPPSIEKSNLSNIYSLNDSTFLEARKKDMSGIQLPVMIVQESKSPDTFQIYDSITLMSPNDKEYQPSTLFGSNKNDDDAYCGIIHQQNYDNFKAQHLAGDLAGLSDSFFGEVNNNNIPLLSYHKKVENLLSDAKLKDVSINRQSLYYDAGNQYIEHERSRKKIQLMQNFFANDGPSRKALMSTLPSGFFSNVVGPFKVSQLSNDLTESDLISDTRPDEENKSYSDFMMSNKDDGQMFFNSPFPVSKTETFPNNTLDRNILETDDHKEIFFQRDSHSCSTYDDPFSLKRKKQQKKEKKQVFFCMIVKLLHTFFLISPSIPSDVPYYQTYFLRRKPKNKTSKLTHVQNQPKHILPEQTFCGKLLPNHFMEYLKLVSEHFEFPTKANIPLTADMISALRAIQQQEDKNFSDLMLTTAAELAQFASNNSNFSPMEVKHTIAIFKGLSRLLPNAEKMKINSLCNMAKSIKVFREAPKQFLNTKLQTKLDTIYTLHKILSKITKTQILIQTFADLQIWAIFACDTHDVKFFALPLLDKLKLNFHRQLLLARTLRHTDRIFPFYHRNIFSMLATAFEKNLEEMRTYLQSPSLSSSSTLLHRENTIKWDFVETHNTVNFHIDISSISHDYFISFTHKCRDHDEVPISIQFCTLVTLFLKNFLKTLMKIINLLTKTQGSIKACLLFTTFFSFLAPTALSSPMNEIALCNANETNEIMWSDYSVTLTLSTTDLLFLTFALLTWVLVHFLQNFFSYQNESTDPNKSYLSYPSDLKCNNCSAGLIYKGNESPIETSSEQFSEEDNDSDISLTIQGINLDDIDNDPDFSILTTSEFSDTKSSSLPNLSLTVLENAPAWYTKLRASLQKKRDKKKEAKRLKKHTMKNQRYQNLIRLDSSSNDENEISAELSHHQDHNATMSNFNTAPPMQLTPFEDMMMFVRDLDKDDMDTSVSSVAEASHANSSIAERDSRGFIDDSILDQAQLLQNDYSPNDDDDSEDLDRKMAALAAQLKLNSLTCNSVSEEDAVGIQVNSLSEGQLDDLQESLSKSRLDRFNQLREALFVRNQGLKLAKASLNQAQILLDKNPANQSATDDLFAAKSDITSLEKNIKTIELEILELSQANQKQVVMPSKYGWANSLPTRVISPYDKIGPQSSISISKLWKALIRLGEDNNLSEEGYKSLLMCHLKGSYLETFLELEQEDLRVIIENLINIFDKNSNKFSFLTKIDSFKRDEGEDLSQTISRLGFLIQRANPTKSKAEIEIIKNHKATSILPTLVSSDVYKRIVQEETQKRHAGREWTINDMCEFGEVMETLERNGKLNVQVNEAQVEAITMEGRKRGREEDQPTQSASKRSTSNERQVIERPRPPSPYPSFNSRLDRPTFTRGQSSDRSGSNFDRSRSFERGNPVNRGGFSNRGSSAGRGFYGRGGFSSMGQNRNFGRFGGAPQRNTGDRRDYNREPFIRHQSREEGQQRPQQMHLNRSDRGGFRPNQDVRQEQGQQGQNWQSQDRNQRNYSSWNNQGRYQWNSPDGNFSVQGSNGRGQLFRQHLTATRPHFISQSLRFDDLCRCNRGPPHARSECRNNRYQRDF